MKKLRKKVEEKFVTLENRVWILEATKTKLEDDKETAIKELIEIENALEHERGTKVKLPKHVKKAEKVIEKNAKKG